MPYNSIDELPKGPHNVLPQHAQEIYLEAFNSAYDEYKNAKDRRGDADREETAHKVAWNAVKKVYEKGDDGHWHKKEKS